MIYFDNAATSAPKPKTVIAAVARAMAKKAANPGRSGHRASAAAAELVYACRSKIAGFFFAPNPEEVIFTKNCTESINLVLKGCLPPGSHVIVSSLEHNAVMRPLHRLSLEGGISYDTAEIDWNHPEKAPAVFEKLIRGNTRLIFCTHASNVLGTRLPIEEIGALCKRRGLLFAVDAAQSAGVLPICVEDFGIDYLCVAPHKGLYAPMGTGILIARKPLRTLCEGGTGTLSVSLDQPEGLPERLESGTLNLPGIAGIGAGIDFINRYPPGRIHQHETGLVRRLHLRLSNIPDIRLYAPGPEPERSVGVLSFNVGDTPSEETAAALDRAGFAVRAGLHCAPSVHQRAGTLSQGMVRVSTSVFHSPAEIEELAAFIEKFAKKSMKNH